MLNIVEILFLVFGWIYNLKGLIITSLIISAFFMLITLSEEGKKSRLSAKIISHHSNLDYLSRQPVLLYQLLRCACKE